MEVIVVDWTTIVVAVVTALGAFIGTFASNRKQTALMAYRLEELEKKVDKHNNMVERTIKLEQRVDDLEKKVG